MAGSLPTRARIAVWDQAAAALEAAAAGWRSAADLLEQSADLYLRHAGTPHGGQWSGAAAESAVAVAHAERTRVYQDTDRARALAAIADRGADGLRWGRQRTLAVIAAAEDAGFTVEDDLSLATDGDVGDTDELRVHAAHAYHDQIVHCAVRLQTEDQDIAARLRAGLADFAARFDNAPAQIPPLDVSPTDVRAWWDALTARQQGRPHSDFPPELGNYNGIPAAVRDRINLSVMYGDIARVERACPGEATDADLIRYRNAVKTRAGLQAARGHGGPVLLWAYDPVAFGGRGRAAISIGDPDVAQDTSVIVPGVGSSVSQGWLTAHDDAGTLYRQSRSADPGRSTAVIAWMGYEAPTSFVDSRLTEPGLARRGGAELARDVDGLWATHRAGMPQHVTVIGHSYGATTVADACAGHRMHASDVVLLGSPGSDVAHRAADFHLDGGRVYVGAASTDPVSWVGQTDGLPGEVAKSWLRRHGIALPFDAGLGRDPAGEGYGSVRFRAEVPGSLAPGVADHVRYYHAGSESLRAITDIVTGHSERLPTDGLLAQGRRQPHLGLPGLPGIPLPHIDTRIPGIPAYIDPEGDRRDVVDDHGY